MPTPTDRDQRLTTLAHRLTQAQEELGFGGYALWMQCMLDGAAIRMSAGDDGALFVSIRSTEHPLMSAGLGPDGIWRAATVVDPLPRLEEWLDALETAGWRCNWIDTVKRAA